MRSPHGVLSMIFGFLTTFWVDIDVQIFRLSSEIELFGIGVFEKQCKKQYIWWFTKNSLYNCPVGAYCVEPPNISCSCVRPSVCPCVRPCHAFSSSRPSSSSSDQLHADQSDYARWLMVWMVGLVGFNRYLRGHSALQVLSSIMFIRFGERWYGRWDGCGSWDWTVNCSHVVF